MRAAALFVFIWLVSLTAWLTHIVYCLQHERWGFLIAGALAFPVAVIHGVMIWLGIVV